MTIEGIGDLKHLPNFMGTLGKVFAKLFSKSGEKKNDPRFRVILEILSLQIISFS